MWYPGLLIPPSNASANQGSLLNCLVSPRSPALMCRLLEDYITMYFVHSLWFNVIHWYKVEILFLVLRRTTVELAWPTPHWIKSFLQFVCWALFLTRPIKAGLLPSCLSQPLPSWCPIISITPIPLNTRPWRKSFDKLWQNPLLTLSIWMDIVPKKGFS